MIVEVNLVKMHISWSNLHITLISISDYIRPKSLLDYRHTNTQDDIPYKNLKCIRIN